MSMAGLTMLKCQMGIARWGAVWHAGGYWRAYRRVVRLSLQETHHVGFRCGESG